MLLMLLLLPAAVVLAAFLCCRAALAAPGESDECALPRSAQYDPYRDAIARMIGAVGRLACEEVYITSRDGLRLRARLYSGRPGAPVHLMFHGYRSSAARDFCGGLALARERGDTVLLVDQRGHGKSQGRYLTLGIRERDDCLDWIAYAVGRFGPDARVLLYGMSMGATTVLLAAGEPLPENVVGVVADCGYSSPEEILRRVLKNRGYPVAPAFALLSLGARIFAGVDLRGGRVDGAMARCRVPVLFIHGGDDRFVPCEMGQRDYACCASREKKLLVVPGAGHGMSFLVDPAAYREGLIWLWRAALGE